MEVRAYLAKAAKSKFDHDSAFLILASLDSTSPSCAGRGDRNLRRATVPQPQTLNSPGLRTMLYAAVASTTEIR
ncbi:hypothetical protein Pla52n_66180 [Stieleria varia]|uniref:Uncharacterized protein n=1 Tax=Stieleria varia TaxID=2528005 RepID=A0A5C5ZUQ1_9BACT|nr:hypothetical protein Pla52n_66180 [Stieleria varia]